MSLTNKENIRPVMSTQNRHGGAAVASGRVVKSTPRASGPHGSRGIRLPHQTNRGPALTTVLNLNQGSGAGPIHGEVGPDVSGHLRAAPLVSCSADGRLRGEDRAEPGTDGLSTARRTHADLEFEWDRTQLRDPRLTPERMVRPRRSNHELSEAEQALYRAQVPPPPARERDCGKKRCSACADADYNHQIQHNIALDAYDVEACFAKGAAGSPTYDRAGFQLDFDKVARCREPQVDGGGRLKRVMDHRLASRESQRACMFYIFFRDQRGPTDSDDVNSAEDLLKDRVSKDLGVAWHKIGPREIEEWRRRGHEPQDPAGYTSASLTHEESKRFMHMLRGASLRR